MSMPVPLRAVVVDDERIPRRFLCSLIAEVDWLELAGEAATGEVALAQIDSQEPDVVFLDVRLPDMSGIEVLERIREGPVVVFTTAFNEYAIPALRLGAVDYLLKPFGRQQFQEAVAQVRKRLEARRWRVAGPAAESHRAPSPRRRIFVRQGAVLVPVALDDVERVEAKRDFAMLFVAGRGYLAHIGLGELESMLDPRRFVRVHRSHIVNLDCVATLNAYDLRRFSVVMKDGFQLTASRAGTRLLRDLVL